MFIQKIELWKNEKKRGNLYKTFSKIKLRIKQIRVTNHRHAFDLSFHHYFDPFLFISTSVDPNLQFLLLHLKSQPLTI